MIDYHVPPSKYINPYENYIFLGGGLWVLFPPFQLPPYLPMSNGRRCSGLGNGQREGHQSFAATPSLAAVCRASTGALHAAGLHGETPGAWKGAGDLWGILWARRLCPGLAGWTSHHLARLFRCGAQGMNIPSSDRQKGAEVLKIWIWMAGEMALVWFQHCQVIIPVALPHSGLYDWSLRWREAGPSACWMWQVDEFAAAPGITRVKYSWILMCCHDAGSILWLWQSLKPWIFGQQPSTVMVNWNSYILILSYTVILYHAILMPFLDKTDLPSIAFNSQILQLPRRRDSTRFLGEYWWSNKKADWQPLLVAGNVFVWHVDVEMW